MSAREKLKSLILVGLLSSLAVAVSAADDEVAGGTETETESTVGDDATACVDLNGHCTTLLVNYVGDEVEFALFRRDAAQDVDNTAASKGAEAADNPSSLDTLYSSAEQQSDSAMRSLGVDFLHGFKEKGNDTTLESTGVSASGSGSVSLRDTHSWASAAATSLDDRLQHDYVDAFAFPTIDEDTTTFWDFEHVYLWRVAEYILESGRYDISQVALDDIYLSPKTNTSSDPEIVVCELNDANNCRPLAD